MEQGEENVRLPIRMSETYKAKVMAAAKLAGAPASTVVRQLLDAWMGVPGASYPNPGQVHSVSPLSSTRGADGRYR